MFQPQPTPFSPFSSYGINISPQPQPQPPPPLLDFNNYQHNHNQNHTLNQNLNHNHNHNHNININNHNHNHNSIPNSQPLHHQLSQSHSHSHSHPHRPSLAQQQRSNSLPHCSSSAHTPPATTAIVDNLVSIVVANQPGQATPAGRGLGNTLQQFQQRHPQQPIFSPVSNNAPNSNSNTNVTGAINISHNSSTNPSLSPSFAHHNQQQYKMEDSGVNDLEAQEALARDFQPALVGPLVGDKRSSMAITEEYAKADPIYVSKTSALPQKYSHYRPILGDGNCGWRAAVFSYFETLLRMGNRGQVEEELARMMSLNNLLTTAGGFDGWLFEDMVDETIHLLRDVADVMETSIQAAESVILDRFNNSETSNAIVYHCRLLASSWLKANPQNYQGFIPDGGGIDQYRKDWLEPPNQEIDHLGMTLLIDVLLKPAGFAVEIVYLDRSEGTQVNSHMFQAEDSNGQSTNPAGPIIYLLYRPGHYDILYKDLLRQSIEMSSNIQVNRATNFTHQHSPQANPAMNTYQTMDLLFSIPGVSLPSPYSNFGSSQYQSPMSQSFAPTPSTALPTALSPMSPTGNSVSTPQSTTSVTSLPNRSSFTSINTPTPIITSPHPFQSTQTTLPIHTLPPPHSHAIPSPTALGIPAPSFRPSKYEWAITADLQEGPVPSFQTSTFKNSHYNTAHYNNPNFQPEEWTPEEDGLGMGSKGGGGASGGYGNWARKRSS